MAIFHAKMHTVETEVWMGCPHECCCGPGILIVLYNTLLILDISSHTKIIAFADDVANLAHGKTLSEA